MQHLIVSEVARRIPGSKPRDITALFYERRLDDSLCPIIGQRRLIPPEYVSVIEAKLRELGRLPEVAHA